MGQSVWIMCCCCTHTSYCLQAELVRQSAEESAWQQQVEAAHLELLNQQKHRAALRSRLEQDAQRAKAEQLRRIAPVAKARARARGLATLGLDPEIMALSEKFGKMANLVDEVQQHMEAQYGLQDGSLRGMPGIQQQQQQQLPPELSWQQQQRQQQKLQQLLQNRQAATNSQSAALAPAAVVPRPASRGGASFSQQVWPSVAVPQTAQPAQQPVPWQQPAQQPPEKQQMYAQPTQGDGQLQPERMQQPVQQYHQQQVLQQQQQRAPPPRSVSPQPPQQQEQQRRHHQVQSPNPRLDRPMPNQMQMPYQRQQ